ncbi:zinc-ribbon domain-containing protein [Methanothermobacter sp. KEPCO-1]|nr:MULTISPECIES: zinc ribbon domain-containing protein [Methanothermobacter]QEF94600.1 zinc-ribbon domain-containing protein [Methanothermobacter sp. KEPCO-1]WBF10766.1 zinc-ribbon domain-containing protein [Methanothermobacter marburgensis]
MDMVYCPSCGERNREGSRFCRNCGTLLEEKPLKSRFMSGDFRESPVKRELQRKEFSDARKEGFEWDTALRGALVLVILMVILGRIFGFMGAIAALMVSVIYVLSSSRRKSQSLMIVFAALLMAAAASALFSI